MSLTIGIPREIYLGEKRVAAVPDVVEKWRKLGFGVAVESGAGALANFADDTYLAAGATVADSAEALYAQADVILKVRAPTSTEVVAMRPGTHCDHLGAGRRANLEDHVGLRVQRFGAIGDRGACSEIRIVCEVGERASARFDGDSEPEFAPFLYDIGNGGDTFFAKIDLTRNTDGQRHGNLRVAAGRADDTTFTFLPLNLVAGLLSLTDR